MKTISEFMSSEVISLVENKTVRDAAELMLEYGISSVVIMSEQEEEEQKPVGLMTSYDILEIIMNKDNTYFNLPLTKYVKPLISIKDSANLVDASKIFIDNQIHHLVVVSDLFELVGIFSTLDLAKALSD